jgi:hypothetical protein
VAANTASKSERGTTKKPPCSAIHNKKTYRMKPNGMANGLANGMTPVSAVRCFRCRISANSFRSEVSA